MHTARSLLRRFVSFLAAGLVSVAPVVCLGASTGLPIEGPLNTFVAFATGPLAKAVCIFGIVGVGMGLALGNSHGNGKLIMVGAGLCVVAAAQWFVGFFGFSGGLLI